MGAHEDDLGMQNIKMDNPKLLEVDRSKVTAQYRGEPAIMTEEGNTMVLLQDVRVMANLHRNTVRSTIVLWKGCKVVHANCDKITLITKEKKVDLQTQS